MSERRICGHKSTQESDIGHSCGMQSSTEDRQQKKKFQLSIGVEKLRKTNYWQLCYHSLPLWPCPIPPNTGDLLSGCCQPQDSLCFWSWFKEKTEGVNSLSQRYSALPPAIPPRGNPDEHIPSLRIKKETDKMQRCSRRNNEDRDTSIYIKSKNCFLKDKPPATAVGCLVPLMLIVQILSCDK